MSVFKERRINLTRKLFTIMILSMDAVFLMSIKNFEIVISDVTKRE